MLRIKKIDLLLAKSFAGPFVVAFGVALFVLVMQFFWLYIDEIAGKGVSMIVLGEMVAYFSVAMFPMALPIAVLISSVMVLGDLAERYELSSMKSAGVSLLRVLKSLIIISICIGIFSYISSDFLIPRANLAFKSRLHDIRRTKPTLTLEEGVFNEDFRNFVIRVGEKGSDGESIEKVQINDLSNSTLGVNKIMADSGAMYNSDDKKYFVMELYRGNQYQQPIARSNPSEKQYTFIRTKFKSWTKIWAMSEFDMSRSDEDRFKTQRSMLSMDQLREQIDSLGRQITAMHKSTTEELTANLERLRNMVPAKKPVEGAPKETSAHIRQKGQRPDSTSTSAFNPGTKFPVQVDFDSVRNAGGEYLQTFAEGERNTLITNAMQTLRGNVSSLTTRKSQIGDRRKERVKSGYELYSKYGFALVCVIFLFIGAPMGAIIRKGGFGWPILVSIIFFVVFIFLTIMCRELAESFVFHPLVAAMTPCAVMTPIAAVLTYRSMRDRTLIEGGGWQRFWRTLTEKFSAWKSREKAK